ncbi:MAG: hypothetical protein HXY51_05745 [Nitrospirae bacterium]|nr:hypothetical protein [Nitrospirota bacterium]
MNKQLPGSFLIGWTIFVWQISQGPDQPAGEINIGAEPIDLTLIDSDVDLDPALPAPFLDVEYTGIREGSSIHWLRSDKQGHTELGRFWCMLECHISSVT